MAGDQALRQRSNQLFRNAAALDPAHIKGILMGQGVVIEQLHRHRRRQVLGRFEQTHQQDRPQEFIDHPLADLQLAEQRQRIDPVVARKGGRVAVEVEHRHQQPGDAETISDGQTLEVAHRGQGLAQGTGQLGAIAEHRRCGLQSLRRPEGTGGEGGEHIGERQLIRQRVDVGVVLPEAAGAGFERLASGGAVRRSAGGVSHPIHQGDAHTRLTQSFGGSPASPAGTDHNNVGRRF